MRRAAGLAMRRGSDRAARQRRASPNMFAIAAVARQSCCTISKFVSKGGNKKTKAHKTKWSLQGQPSHATRRQASRSRSVAHEQVDAREAIARAEAESAEQQRSVLGEGERVEDLCGGRGRCGGCGLRRGRLGGRGLGWRGLGGGASSFGRAPAHVRALAPCRAQRRSEQRLGACVGLRVVSRCKTEQLRLQRVGICSAHMQCACTAHALHMHCTCTAHAQRVDSSLQVQALPGARLTCSTGWVGVRSGTSAKLTKARAWPGAPITKLWAARLRKRWRKAASPGRP